MIGDNDSDCDDEKHSSHGRYKLNTSAHRDHDELTLFVGNLPLKTSPNDFTTYLKNHYGENKVRNVRLITDKTTGALKGYGYIDVADMDTLQYMMMDLKRKDYQGRKLRVDKSLSEKSMNRKNELKSSDKQDPVSSSVTHASKSISSPHNKQIYTLFLGNIPYSTTKEAITEFVSDELGADNVADLRLNYDQQTGRLKPYGFIDVYGQETVETALLRIPSRPFHSSGNRNHEDHYFRIDVSESPKKKTLSSSKRLQENNNDRLHTSNDPHIIPTALYINNIPPHTDRDDFHSFMEEKLGKENIKEIRLVYDRDGNSKGFGFLDIYDEDFGHEAMKIIRSCQYDGYYLRADFSSIKKMK
jgi:RNA recognition motif-containing protein